LRTAGRFTYSPAAFCELFAVLLLVTAAVAQRLAQQIPALPKADAIRINEFYRLAARIQDQVWPRWSATPAPLLLLTAGMEFLTHHPAPPSDFKKVGDDWYARARQFPPDLQATFPAFGPPAVIVIGEPQNTSSKTSTPWLFTVMHEHFHQLQYGQPGYYQAVKGLGLDQGDQTGMWVLNYPFPYKKPEVVRAFTALRDLLLRAVAENDQGKFQKQAAQYVLARKRFFAELSPDDAKYLNFQLWQEGIARYTQIRAAESAVEYQPTAEYNGLADFEPFAAYASTAREETLAELKRVDITKSQREVVYSFGATEGFLLDRLHPTWTERYFAQPFRMDALFED
jgi:hypothetical protein